jgi:hypothetical protein
VADGLEITIDTKELEAALERLPAKFAGTIIKEGLQEAGDVISMNAMCPERTDDVENSPESNSLEPGVLKESLTTQVQVKPGSKYPPRVKVGPPSETSHVAWFLENGFDSVKAHRHIPGKHFMSAAFDESAQAAIDVLVASLGEALEKGE